MTYQNTQRQNPATGNAPTHRVYHVRKYTDGQGQEKSFWTELGVAWRNKDGEGFNIQLTSIPLDGHLTLRPPRQRNDNTPGNQPG